jgi:putative DNA methylase
MPSHDDRRLIEDYLPISKIGDAATSEPRSKGHISTLHRWRARRPLVGCRAAVYSALVPASQFTPPNGSEGKRASLARANAARFIEALCRYPAAEPVLADARRHVLQAHAERLSDETGEPISLADIEAARAPRPKVLDMFAGGGAIPLEALRLGCEAHAVELNSVAHLIELGTITYPQRYGAHLADEIGKWARLVLDRTQEQTADLYPTMALRDDGSACVVASAAGAEPLSIVAHYWTRTVPCKNTACRGTVPLYRQTWLRKRANGYVALRPRPDQKAKRVVFEVVTAGSQSGVGFDPGSGISGTATSCPFCQSAVDAEYVRSYGDAHGFGQQLMCVIALNPKGSGKVYIADESLAEGEDERQALAEGRAAAIEAELGSSSLDEEIPPTGNAGLATGKSYLYGIRTFRQAFTPRQRCVLLTMAREIHRAYAEMLCTGMEAERAKALAAYLGLWLSRLTDRFNVLASWDNSGEKTQSLTCLKRFAMMWDFPEVNLFGGASGDAWGNLGYITAAVRREAHAGTPAECLRGSADELPFEPETFDAVVTDPPYYDNESYSELSDVSYVWLRPTIGFLFPEHFSTALTPKKKECVAAAYRQGGKAAAKAFYEDCLFRSLAEAHRVLKPSGLLVTIYAHKTTAGWATLVDAVRRAGFEVLEAWPIEMETKAPVAHEGDAALKSNIFFAARKREGDATGSYEDDVQPELREVVRERVDALWEMGVAGADLVIAAVGAGLRPFTRFARVEYANGEEVPADRFLTEVEGAVLETLLERIFGVAKSRVASVDGASRFYVLWRYTYGNAEMDAGEAIVFTYGQSVELDGPNGLSAGTRALVEKGKASYRLRDFAERGENENLGLPDRQTGRPPPLIDSLHRILWIIENEPRNLSAFLDEALPDRDRLRLVAQALAGPGLRSSGGLVSPDVPVQSVTTTPREQAALGKLLANWKALIESRLGLLDGTLFDTRER